MGSGRIIYVLYEGTPIYNVKVHLGASKLEILNLIGRHKSFLEYTKDLNSFNCKFITTNIVNIRSEKVIYGEENDFDFGT